MITIKQLKKMPLATKVGGGFVLTIKTTKKTTQLPNDRWIHTVVLFDATGEMLADVNIGKGKYVPLVRSSQLAIIVAEIQATDADPKLYVDQFRKVSVTANGYGPDPDYNYDWENIVRGKVRHGVVCAFIQAGKPVVQIDKAEVEKIVEYIMTGK